MHDETFMNTKGKSRWKQHKNNKQQTTCFTLIYTTQESSPAVIQGGSREKTVKMSKMQYFGESHFSRAAAK